MTDEAPADDFARKNHMTLSVKMWRWIFGITGIGVLGLGIVKFGPEQSVEYSAALSGAGVLIGVLVSLLFAGRMDSKWSQRTLVAMAFAAVGLLVFGMLSLGLSPEEKTGFIAMAGAVLSAVGGAAAGRLHPYPTDVPPAERDGVAPRA